jgi:hypothetical protein
VPVNGLSARQQTPHGFGFLVIAQRQPHDGLNGFGEPTMAA